MYKLTKSISLIAVVFMLIAVNSCAKDDIIVSNDDGTEWNTGTEYPYVLPETMQPYQYAVYQDDIGKLFDYMQLVFDSYKEGDERGYFILSPNDANALIYCGYVTESSSHFNPAIFIEDPDNPFIIIDDYDDDEMMYGCKNIESTNKDKVVKWATKKLESGKYKEVAIWQEGNLWKAEACK